MRHVPALVVLALGIALTAALVAPRAAAADDVPADGADAGPQPGDVDETFPIVEEADARAADAGPRVTTAAPRPVEVPVAPPATGTPSTTSTPAPDPTAPVEVDDVDAGPAPAVPAPRAVAAKPRVEHAAPRPDPDAQRAPAPPPPTPPVEAKPSALPEGFGFGGVPALNYNADDGFGFGVVGTAFYYDGHTHPYRAAVTLQLFMTSKLVQDHNVVVDWLDVGGLPLRLWARVGYLQSLTQNYCGLGGAVTCDPAPAKQEAFAAGLAGKAADTFERRFYERRFINPYATFQARYALVEKPARFEVTAGYRGFYFLPGTWDDEDKDGKPDLFPYPGSLYAKDFRDGEPGYDSVVSLGFMLDSRDNEPAPTEGVWLEASVRAASSLIGSTWDWTGMNVTARTYLPLRDNHRLVWANRLVFDGILGDPPIQELARVGGSNDYYVYGGSDAGRGIRVQRYLGKLRAFDQSELRWRFLDVGFLEQDFGFTAAGFLDVGVVGKEIADPGPMAPLPGFGGALRLSWNENFVIRLDVGFSPLEQYEPEVYLLIGNPF